MTPCSQCGLILGMNAGVVSVNVAKASDASYARLGRSAMDKRPQDAPLWCSTLGLTGDECFDVKHHGGIDQAVYAFAREDLDWWVEQLQMPLSPGMFGENLTTSGIDVNEAEVGERWRVGEFVRERFTITIPATWTAASAGLGMTVQADDSRGVVHTGTNASNESNLIILGDLPVTIAVPAGSGSATP